MLIYICSPLRGNLEENINKARQYAKETALKGNIPIASYCLFTQFLNDEIPEERQRGIEMELELLLKCDAILVCDNIITEGMAIEIKAAMDRGIKIFGRDLEVENIIEIVSENKMNESMYL